MRRTRAGCEVCKRRHVKCDEAKPVCGHCKRRGDTCVYNPPKTWVFDPQQPRPLAASPESSRSAPDASTTPQLLGSHELPERLQDLAGSSAGYPNSGSYADKPLSIDTHNVASAFAPLLGGTSPGQAPLLPQIRQAEIAFAYFIQALSIANDAFYLSGDGAGDEANYYHQVKRALDLINAADMVNHETTVIMCNALVASSELGRTGDLFALQKYNEMSVNTLHEWTTSSGRDDLQRPEPVRRASQAEPYITSLMEGIEHSWSQPSDFPEGLAVPKCNPLEYLGVFTSLTQAISSLHSIVMFQILSVIRPSQLSWLIGPTQNTIQALLDAWLHSFSRLEFSGELDSSPDTQRLCRCVTMHHTACVILNACLPLHDESAFLGQEVRFESIVADLEYLIQHDDDQAQSRGLYAPLNIIPPAFLTATKCRNSVLRRRALEVLRVANMSEGAWNSLTAYHIASMIISVEEDLHGQPTASGVSQQASSPVHAESAHFTLDSRRKRGTITLRYSDPSGYAPGILVKHRHIQDEQTLRALCEPFWPLDPTLRSWGYIQSNLVPSTQTSGDHLNITSSVMVQFQSPIRGGDVFDATESA